MFLVHAIQAGNPIPSSLPESLYQSAFQHDVGSSVTNISTDPGPLFEPEPEPEELAPGPELKDIDPASVSMIYKYQITSRLGYYVRRKSTV